MRKRHLEKCGSYYFLASSFLNVLYSLNIFRDQLPFSSNGSAAIPVYVAFSRILSMMVSVNKSNVLVITLL